MQYFSFSNYLSLTLSALVYGLIFSFIVLAASMADFFVKQIFRGVFYSVIYFGRLTDVTFLTVKYKKKADNKFISNLVCASKILFFILGFILVSYSVFDGEIRLFALAVSIFVFFLFSRYVLPIPKKIIFRVFTKIIAYFCILIRVILYPLRKIALHFAKKSKFYLLFDSICKLNSIDNIDKK